MKGWGCEHAYGPNGRCELSHEDAMAWMECMTHDGKDGPLWSEEDTTAVAVKAGMTFMKITNEQLCIAMNYMWAPLKTYDSQADTSFNLIFCPNFQPIHPGLPSNLNKSEVKI